MWHEYYRARLFARIAVLAFPLAIVVFVLVAPKNLTWISNLSGSRMLILRFEIIGALALPFALPFFIGFGAVPALRPSLRAAASAHRLGGPVHADNAAHLALAPRP